MAVRVCWHAISIANNVSMADLYRGSGNTQHIERWAGRKEMLVVAIGRIRGMLFFYEWEPRALLINTTLHATASTCPLHQSRVQCSDWFVIPRFNCNIMSPPLTTPASALHVLDHGSHVNERGVV